MKVLTRNRSKHNQSNAIDNTGGNEIIVNPVKRRSVMKRKNYTDEDMANGMEEVAKGSSINAAAKKFKLPFSTLHSKVKNPDSLGKKSGRGNVLSIAEEKKFVDWIIRKGQEGLPVTKDDLIAKVENYLIKHNKVTRFTNNIPGKDWFKYFRRRHPEITFRRCQKLSVGMASITEKQIRKWFLNLEGYLEEKNLLNIDSRRIFNCDESNFILHPKADTVLTKKGCKRVYSVVQGQQKDNITVLFMYNAAGERVPPMVLHKGRSVPVEVVANHPEGWRIGVTDSGWMNSTAFTNYISTVFYPWLLEQQIQLPVIVYMNGHGSYKSLELLKFCAESSIELVTLYPNATHILQPLDTCFFHPLKNMYRTKARRLWQRRNEGRTVKKENFTQILNLALQLLTDEQGIIKNAFKTTGLFPLDPNNVNYEILLKNKKIQESNDNENESIDISAAGCRQNTNTTFSLQTLEGTIPKSLLKAFQYYKEKGTWGGATENKGLFHLWMKLKYNFDSSFVEEEINEIETSPVPLSKHTECENEKLNNLNEENLYNIDESVESSEMIENVSLTNIPDDGVAVRLQNKYEDCVRPEPVSYVVHTTEKAQGIYAVPDSMTPESFMTADFESYGGIAGANEAVNEIPIENYYTQEPVYVELQDNNFAQEMTNVASTAETIYTSNLQGS